MHFWNKTFLRSRFSLGGLRTAQNRHHAARSIVVVAVIAPLLSSLFVCELCVFSEFLY